MDPDKKSVRDLCKDALAMCKSLDIALVGMQNRLSLGMPVNATMKIVECDIQALDVRIEELRKAVEKELESAEEITAEV